MKTKLDLDTQPEILSVMLKSDGYTDDGIIFIAMSDCNIVKSPKNSLYYKNLEWLSLPEYAVRCNLGPASPDLNRFIRLSYDKLDGKVSKLTSAYESKLIASNFASVDEKSTPAQMDDFVNTIRVASKGIATPRQYTVQLEDEPIYGSTSTPARAIPCHRHSAPYSESLGTTLIFPVFPRITNTFNAQWSINELNAMNTLLEYLYANYVTLRNNDNSTLDALNGLINYTNVLTNYVNLLATPPYSAYVSLVSRFPGPVSSANSASGILDIPAGTYLVTVSFSISSTNTANSLNRLQVTGATTRDDHVAYVAGSITIKSYCFSVYANHPGGTSTVTVSNNIFVGTPNVTILDITWTK